MNNNQDNKIIEMKAYKVEIKKNNKADNAPNWGDENYIVFGRTYEEAGEEAERLVKSGEIMSIAYIGDCTRGERGPIALKSRW